ncbi:hypothetical protein LS70_007955 [Helicobacter sp. MIT 11-5569]|uniref:hypothetical protein n=1 Tax=Helicobacter sp. MIT 11-5569 TaxID=1548151 RepID=UPI00051F97F0|nr:hypothetical protein [Helicobacter sp. MIT 11-5569]TLD81218.1 hypothetical protein LS70_007955 [Helicobacter sp. MIT 11-5569]
MLGKINSDNTTNTSWFSRSVSVAQNEGEDFDAQRIKAIEQEIEKWLENPSGIFDYTYSLAQTDSLYKNSKINESVEWESSKKFSSVGESQYQNAQDYLFGQINEILVTTYLSEGDSSFFATLLAYASAAKLAFANANKGLDSIEDSASCFVDATKSKDKNRILEAEKRLDEDLGKISSFSYLALPSLTNFFSIADGKIPQENMQKIIDSLGIMRSYIDENLALHKTGSITLKNGTTISGIIDDNGHKILKVSLQNNVANNLFLNYEYQNLDLLLKMQEQGENREFAQKQMSDTILTQLLQENGQLNKKY